VNPVDSDINDECEMLLMDYARGVLNEAQRVLVSSYIEMSEQAQQRATLFECLGGAVMESCCEPVAMMEDSLQAVMEQLENCKQEEACAPYEPRHTINIPMPQSLCMEISVRCGPSAAWRRVWPGVQMLSIPVEVDGCAMFITRIHPGAQIPRHRHESREVTLVLDGAFTDVSGAHKRGDILIMDPGTAHVLQADAKEGCVCLIVHEARRGIIPLHWLVRVLGRF